MDAETPGTLARMRGPLVLFPIGRVLGRFRLSSSFGAAKRRGTSGWSPLRQKMCGFVRSPRSETKGTERMSA